MDLPKRRPERRTPRPAPLDPGETRDLTLAMARVAGALFVGGSILALQALLLPHPDAANEVGLMACAVISGLTGALVLAFSARLRPVHFHAIEALATLLITAALLWSGRAADGTTLDIQILYLCPALISAYFLGARGAALQLGLIGAGYAAVVISSDGALTRWTVTLGTLSMVAWVVAGLRRDSLQEVAARERTSALLAATLESTAEGIMVISGGNVVRANRRLREMFGAPEAVVEASRDEIAKWAAKQMVDPDKYWRGVQALINDPTTPRYDELVMRDGRVFEQTTFPQKQNGRVTGQVLCFRDVTERKRSEERLQQLADHDPLTGLVNRRRFEEELDREVERQRTADRAGAVLLLDLDNFKYVNDTFGHVGGDEVVRGMGRLLRTSVRPGDTIARLGGDEFAVLLPDVDGAEARRRAEELIQLVRGQTILIGAQLVRVTTSIGVVTLENGPRSGSELMVAADRAMYRAKDTGRDRVTIFDPKHSGNTESRERVAWTSRIRDAIESDRLVLHAQPILDLRLDEITRHELLVRMRSEDGTLMPPGAFLGHAERFGQITEIDRWVFGQALELVSAQAELGKRIFLELNVSAHTIDDPSIAAEMEQRILASGIDPECLTFEMTETAAIASMDTARRFAETMTDLGCSFALDDFGAGFGSFYYLKNFPVNFIKIDGDFVRGLEHSKVDRLVIDSIVQIARNLGMETIAEYATSASVVEQLRRHDVDFAQGYGIGRPVPVEEVWVAGADDLANTGTPAG